MVAVQALQGRVTASCEGFSRRTPGMKHTSTAHALSQRLPVALQAARCSTHGRCTQAEPQTCSTHRQQAMQQALLQTAHAPGGAVSGARTQHTSVTLARSRIPCSLGRLPLAALLGVEERGQQWVALADGE